MRLPPLGLLLSLLAATAAVAQGPAAHPPLYVGFDRNEYPGDETLTSLHHHFNFTGYWLNPPPGAAANSWTGKRDTLLQADFGFLVLWNGRLDAAILKAQSSGTSAATLGQHDAEAAIAAARQEHFPPGTILFLDQEEGGRLLKEQADYLFAWTEHVARSSYSPGVYASGQPSPDGPGQTITTAQDIREHVASAHLPVVALWVAQDACPPSDGCSLRPPGLARSGTPGAFVWQYAQSPRRPALTQACSNTYAPDGNCYVPELPGLHLDLNVASTPDPSHGR